MAFVYFIKHNDFRGVKIGMTNKDDVQDRLKAANTYSPRGAVLLGQIETFDAAELEKIIHKDFADNRMNGEFFDIDEEEVQEICENYSYTGLNILYVFVIFIRVFSKQQRIIAIEQPHLLAKMFDYYGHSFEIIDRITIHTSETNDITLSKFIKNKYFHILPVMEGMWFEVKKK